MSQKFPILRKLASACAFFRVVRLNPVHDPVKFTLAPAPAGQNPPSRDPVCGHIYASVLLVSFSTHTARQPHAETRRSARPRMPHAVQKKVSRAQGPRWGHRPCDASCALRHGSCPALLQPHVPAPPALGSVSSYASSPFSKVVVLDSTRRMCVSHGSLAPVSSGGNVSSSLDGSSTLRASHPCSDDIYATTLLHSNFPLFTSSITCSPLWSASGMAFMSFSR